MQRAGRSGHAPGRTSRVTLVPTHSVEVVEAAAAQVAIAERRIEARSAPHRPLDVLVQHLVSMALGGGFRPDELYAEVRQAWSYRELTDEHWQWALAFVRHGGHSLTAYPDYQRVEPDETGLWKVPCRRVALRHRMSIGTIVSDASLTVKFWAKGGGVSLGGIEEGFIARLRPGDNFLFGGRLLELVRVENMTAYVSRATGKRLPCRALERRAHAAISELADAVVEQLGAASREQFTTPKCAWSNRCFASRWTGRAAHQDHLAGRGDEVPRRLAPVPLPLRRAPCAPGPGQPAGLAHKPTAAMTFSIAVNDYGFELLSATEVDWLHWLTPELFSENDLLHDVLASLNASELARRRFARSRASPGWYFPATRVRRRARASAAGFQWPVLRCVPPVRSRQSAADPGRGRGAAPGAGSRALAADVATPATAPSGRPPGAARDPAGLSSDGRRFRALSSEKLADRIRRMVAELDKAAGPGGYQPEPQSTITIERDARDRASPAHARTARRAQEGQTRLMNRATGRTDGS